MSRIGMLLPLALPLEFLVQHFRQIDVHEAGATNEDATRSNLNAAARKIERRRFDTAPAVRLASEMLNEVVQDLPPKGESYWSKERRG